MYMDNNKKDGHEDIDLESYKTTGKNGNMVRLFVNIGAKDNISPRHIVGAITGQTSLPRKSVGGIDIYDKFSFVEVPEEYVKETIAGLKDHRIKGRRINAEIAKSRK
mgnify:FL=1